MNKKAFSLFELLVVISLSSLVMLAALGLFTRTSKIKNDIEIITQTQTNSSILMSLVGREIQNIGTGMALNLDSAKMKNSFFTEHNSNPNPEYKIAITDTLPLIYDQCSDSQIAYRQNSSGRIYNLTEQLVPNRSGNTIITLDSVEGLSDKQKFIISGKNSGSEFMLMGVIEGTPGTDNKISVPNFTVANSHGIPQAVFEIGDTFEPIDEIFITSYAENQIVRSFRKGTVFSEEVVLAENASMFFRYLGDTGNPTNPSPFFIEDSAFFFGTTGMNDGYIYNLLTGVRVELTSAPQRKRRLSSEALPELPTKVRNFAIRSLKTVI